MDLILSVPELPYLFCRRFQRMYVGLGVTLIDVSRI